MKTDTPMKSLKHYIELISELLGDNYLIARVDGQGEKKPTEYSYGQKNVQADYVVFWTSKSDSKGLFSLKKGDKRSHKMEHPSIGLSFQYLGLKTPFVIFSHVESGKPKSIKYSSPYTVEEARMTLKRLLKPKYQNSEEMCSTLADCFINFEMLDESVKDCVLKRHESINDETKVFTAIINRATSKVKTLMDLLPEAMKMQEKRLLKASGELNKTPEYAEYKKAERAFKLAEEKMKVKQAEIKAADTVLTEATKIVNSASKPPCLGDAVADALVSIINEVDASDDVRTKVRISMIGKAYRILREKFEPLAALGEVGHTYRLDRTMQDFTKKQQAKQKQK